MTLSVEVQLIGLILALYLHDSILLLYSNEGVLTSSGNGKWKLGLGFANTHIFGKELYLPNLLTVYRPMYRMRWEFEAEPPDGVQKDHGQASGPVAAPAGWAPHPEAFSRLGKITMLLWVLQLVAFPTVMFFYQTDIAVVGVLVAIYLTIILALREVWTKTQTFGLTGKKFAGTCFECLVCPPLAINLVRRFSLDLCKSADLVAVAGALMDPSRWESAQAQLCVRIEDQMSIEPEDSKRYTAMQNRLELLSPKRESQKNEHE